VTAPPCFDHQRRPERQHVGNPVFQPPNLRISQDLPPTRLFDRRETDAIQDRYGRNLFGPSCLLARLIVEAGVSMIK
jgi:hypothetical protein